MLRVMDRRCPHCPYDGDRPAATPEAKALFEQCRRSEVHVTCRLALEAGEDICCKAHFEVGHSGRIMKAAERMALVEFVSVDDYERRAREREREQHSH